MRTRHDMFMDGQQNAALSYLDHIREPRVAYETTLPLLPVMRLG